MKTVSIKLNFGPGTEDHKAEIETNDVPITLILDMLKTLSTAFAKQIVEEAEEMVPPSEWEKYINARLKVDREKEKDF